MTDTSYSYDKELITNTNDIQSTLFNRGDYWIASRCSRGMSYAIRLVSNQKVQYGTPCTAENVLRGYRGEYYVRPVVILKSNSIDTNVDYNKEVGWTLK